MADFVKVAKLNEIGEGKMKLVEVNGEEIFLINFKGKIHAYEEHCPHEEGPLHEGWIEGNELVCPLHQAKFDIASGKVNPETDWAPHGLKKFEVKIQGEDVLVKV